MLAHITAPTDAERAVNDSYAGNLAVQVVIGLDDSDPPIRTSHDLARVLLECTPTNLRYQED